MHGFRTQVDFGAWGDFSRGNFQPSNYPNHPNIYYPPYDTDERKRIRGALRAYCELVGAGEDDVQWRTSRPSATGLPAVSHLAVVF